MEWTVKRLQKASAYAHDDSGKNNVYLCGIYLTCLFAVITKYKINDGRIAHVVDAELQMLSVVTIIYCRQQLAPWSRIIPTRPRAMSLCRCCCYCWWWWCWSRRYLMRSLALCSQWVLGVQNIDRILTCPESHSFFALLFGLFLAVYLLYSNHCNQQTYSRFSNLHRLTRFV